MPEHGANGASSEVVMVVNRGEIARRVMRSCTSHGVKTVAVFTAVDALSPHVKDATFAAYLGPNHRDYTNAAKLLQVCRPWVILSTSH